MSEVQPTRESRDLAETVEMLLDKGVVINADIVVSIGDRELLGIEVRAALASFDTAAKYGLAFPSGTDRYRLAQAAGVEVPVRDIDRAQTTLPEAARGGTSTVEETNQSTEYSTQSDGTGESQSERTGSIETPEQEVSTDE